jgi:hypothetical protein
MNNAQKKLRSINCTQCGGSIALRGGHRVKSIVCEYCGSVLDAKHEYKVLRRFVEAQRPHSPLKLGMSGKIKGVEFTVIGIVQYRTPDLYTWIAAQLFSPTHGYAWLEYEGGHFTFSRRVRDRPLTQPSMKVKSVFKARGRSFKVYEHYSAKIIFVEGELTFIAEQGDQVTITEGIDPPFLFAVEKTASEEEYSLSEYLEPEEIDKAFGIKGKLTKRSTVHAAQPYRSHPLVSGMSDASRYFAPITFVLAILIWALGSGTTILEERLHAKQFLDGAQTHSFTVSNADSLLKMQLYSGLQNAWAWFDVTIIKDQQKVFSMAEEISYYSGYEGGEHWSEGSQSASAYFKVPEVGQYTLYVEGEGGQGNSGQKAQEKALQIKIQEGIVVSRYFIILAVLFTILFGLKYIMKAKFEAKRWKVVTGDD